MKTVQDLICACFAAHLCAPSKDVHLHCNRRTVDTVSLANNNEDRSTTGFDLRVDVAHLCAACKDVHLHCNKRIMDTVNLVVMMKPAQDGAAVLDLRMDAAHLRAPCQDVHLHANKPSWIP